MQTENTKAVLKDDNFVSCVLPPLPLPAACRGHGLPGGLLRDWVGKKSYGGQGPGSLSLLLSPAALFLSSSSQSGSFQLGIHQDLWGSRFTVQVTYLSYCLCAVLLGQLGPSWAPVWGSCEWSGCKGLSRIVWTVRHSQFCGSSFLLFFTPWENSWSLCLGSSIYESWDMWDAAVLRQQQAWLQPSSVSLWFCPSAGVSLLPHPSSVLAGSQVCLLHRHLQSFSGDSSGSQIPLQLWAAQWNSLTVFRVPYVLFVGRSFSALLYSLLIF